MNKSPPSRRRGAPTIHDVATYAGVSRMTVSRVINGEDRVKPETRRLVDAAIRALNYAPNPAARSCRAESPSTQRRARGESLGASSRTPSASAAPAIRWIA